VSDTFIRPNGKAYRPRKPGLRAQAWENHGGHRDQSQGVIVFGTLDPERARALAQECCASWYGDADLYELIEIRPGWYRDTFSYLGRTFVLDEERGSAGVMFTWGESVNEPHPSCEAHPCGASLTARCFNGASGCSTHPRTRCPGSIVLGEDGPPAFCGSTRAHAAHDLYESGTGSNPGDAR